MGMSPESHFLPRNIIITRVHLRGDDKFKMRLGTIGLIHYSSLFDKLASFSTLKISDQNFPCKKARSFKNCVSMHNLLKLTIHLKFTNTIRLMMQNKTIPNRKRRDQAREDKGNHKSPGKPVVEWK